MFKLKGFDFEQFYTRHCPYFVLNYVVKLHRKLNQTEGKFQPCFFYCYCSEILLTFITFQCG